MNTIVDIILDVEKEVIEFWNNNWIVYKIPFSLKYKRNIKGALDILEQEGYSYNMENVNETYEYLKLHYSLPESKP